MKKVLLTSLLSLVLLAPSLAAQERQPPAPARLIPLKIQVVVSRFQGEKKVSSMPYTLSVVANDNDKTTLRMGVEVPVPSTVFAPAAQGGPATVPVTSYSYRSVGTNIDCTAKTQDDGFRLDMAVEESSVFVAEKATGRLDSAPSFRRFTSTFNVLLRDGQTVQHTTATDPVSGEVLKVDLTLNVLK